MKSSICASTWLAKDALVTKLGWPVAHPKLTSRPLANTISRLPIGEDDLVDLRLDLLPRIVAQCVDLDLAVKMADVADDRTILHMPHMVDRDQVDVAGGGDKNVAV